MALYGKDRVILYNIARGMDTSKPYQRFLEYTQSIENKNNNNIVFENTIPTYYANWSLVENKSSGILLPSTLEGHLLYNGKSLLFLHTDDSKTFSLFSINCHGHSTKVKEFTTNQFYKDIIFSTDLKFCLLFDETKDKTLTHRKLSISYFKFNADKTQHQIQRNVLTLKFHNSFALVNQRRYQLSPQGNILAIIHFSNTNKRLDLVRIVENQDEKTLCLNHIKTVDLTDHFLWNFLREVRFSSTEDKLLLASSRTVKEDNTMICSLKTGHIYSLDFLFSYKKGDLVDYFMVNDYKYHELVFRTSTSGQIEMIKLTDKQYMNLQKFNLRDLGISKQLSCFSVSSFLKETNIVVGCYTGEVYMINAHSHQVVLRVNMGNNDFKIASIIMNPSAKEIFAMKECHKKERGELRVCRIPNRTVSTLEELAARMILQNYPIKFLKTLKIPFLLRYLVH